MSHTNRDFSPNTTVRSGDRMQAQGLVGRVTPRKDSVAHLAAGIWRDGKPVPQGLKHYVPRKEEAKPDNGLV